MKKITRIVLALLLVCGLTACTQAQVALVNVEVNGFSMSLPEDIGAFTASSNFMVANNEAKTEIVTISDILDANGLSPETYTEETFISMQLSTATDVEFVKLDTGASVSDYPAVFADVKAKTQGGTSIEMFGYVVFYGDDTCQFALMTVNAGVETALLANKDAVVNSFALVY